jgi:thiamine biosynthesis lipoprotein
MARLVAAVVAAARMTGGLVDATLLHEIEDAGYRADLGAPVPPALALRLAPPRRPARPSAASRRREIRVRDGVVFRPPGVAIDSGGLAKGLFADLIADSLPHAALAVDCGGDVRFRGPERRIHVADPFGGSSLHAFSLRTGAAATTGILRRSWLDARGRPAHHLLDPATGRPAYTGVVQATALAPTALEAEIRAKAALLSGPDAAAAWLPHGGVLVLDDGRHVILEEDPDPDSRAVRVGDDELLALVGHGQPRAVRAQRRVVVPVVGGHAPLVRRVLQPEPPLRALTALRMWPLRSSRTIWSSCSAPIVPSSACEGDE